MEIIAEVGLAHDGSMTAANAYIDACAAAGVDGVKFQCHDGDPVKRWRVKPAWFTGTRDQYWSLTSFALWEWEALAEHCTQRSVEFLCSVFSLDALKLIDPLVKRHKIPSGRVADLVLLQAVKDTGKPVILSWGMATRVEMKVALDLLGKGTQVLECATKCPADPEDISLPAAAGWRGLSDHSGTIWPGIAAAALGCQMLEVHVCWSKEQGTLDAEASLDMGQLRQLVDGVRFVERAMHPADKDAQARELADVRRVFM